MLHINWPFLVSDTASCTEDSKAKYPVLDQIYHNLLLLAELTCTIHVYVCKCDFVHMYIYKMSYL